MPAKLFHGIGPPLVIAAVKHVWHATGREVADGHPFSPSAHVRELAGAVNDTPRPFGLGRISLPRIVRVLNEVGWPRIAGLLIELNLRSKGLRRKRRGQ
jgi:hypothetical protein